MFWVTIFSWTASSLWLQQLTAKIFEECWLWPPHAKSWLIGKDFDAGRDWGAGGEGDERGWDGWMASLTRWTWVWVNPGVGETGRPGVLWFMGLQRVGQDWATELNWTEKTSNYLKTCPTSFPGAQHASLHPELPKSLLKVNSCSSTGFNLCRGRWQMSLLFSCWRCSWQVSVCSWQSLGCTRVFLLVSSLFTRSIALHVEVFLCI